jgi:hypothetical protein
MARALINSIYMPFRDETTCSRFVSFLLICHICLEHLRVTHFHVRVTLPTNPNMIRGLIEIDVFFSLVSLALFDSLVFLWLRFGKQLLILVECLNLKNQMCNACHHFVCLFVLAVRITKCGMLVIILFVCLSDCTCCANNQMWNACYHFVCLYLLCE